jgi:hypothetical protein
MSDNEDFVRIRIKRSDHGRITRRVTYHKKMHDVITDALDALEKEKGKEKGNSIMRKKTHS